MKWRVLLFLMTALLISACRTVSADEPTRLLPVSPTEFHPVVTVPTASAVASARPVTTPRPRSTANLVGTPTGRADTGRRVIRGEASWGYGFKGHVVTRYPRGTVIRVCGRLGCTPKVRSWGYGPAKRTGRIADLDVNVFEDVCGPRSMGVCNIKLEVWK